MRKLHFLLFAAIALLISSCAKDEKKAVVDDFFAALEKGDFETAKKHSDAETQKILVILEKEYQNGKGKIKDPEAIKIEVIEKEPDAEKPTFTVNIYVGTVMKTIIVPLILVEERWVVVIPRRDLVVLQFLVFCNQYHIIFLSPDVHIHYKTKKHTKKYTKKKTKKWH